MNYLAHAYLSGSNKDIAIGNFIADNIKGNNYKKFNINWQKGILLHRFIDSYTLIIYLGNIQNYSLTHIGITAGFLLIFFMIISWLKIGKNIV